MIDTTRRSFLSNIFAGAIALVAAPAIVRIENIMSVRVVGPITEVIDPWQGWLPCDGRELLTRDHPRLVHFLGRRRYTSEQVPEVFRLPDFRAVDGYSSADYRILVDEGVAYGNNMRLGTTRPAVVSEKKLVG